MKKLFSLSAAVMLSVAAFAQDTIPNRQNSNPSNKDTIPSTNKNWNDTSNKSRTMDSMYQKRNYPDSLKNDTSFATNNQSNVDSLSTNTTTLNRSDSMSTTSSTQTNTTGNNTTTTTTTTLDSTTVLSDRVIMRDEAMFIILDGQTNNLTETYKLESGAKVTSDGTVTYPSGKTVKLKNGQFIEITKSSKDKDNSETATGEKKTTKTEKTTKTTKKSSKKTKPGTT